MVKTIYNKGTREEGAKRMKKLAIGIFLILSIGVFGESIDIVANWETGDIIKYENTIQKYRKQNDKVLINSIIAENLEIKIMDQTENGYSVNWIYKTNYESEEMRKYPFLSDFYRETGDIVYEIETDEYGRLVDLKNWEKIREIIFKGANSILKNDDENNNKSDRTTMEQIFANLKTLFGSKENTMAIGFKDGSLYYCLYGSVMEIGKSVSYDSELQNPFGGLPFKCKGRIEASRINDEMIRIIVKQEIDKEQSFDIVADIIKKMTAGTTIDNKEFEKLKGDVIVKDTVTIEYNTITTINEFVKSEREIDFGGLYQKNTRVLKRVD